MRIDIITVLPELLKSPFEASIMKRAIDSGHVEVYFHNLEILLQIITNLLMTINLVEVPEWL